MEQQDWEDRELDKDILSKSGNLYNPENCVFISRKLNQVFTKDRIKQSGLPRGVYWSKQNKKCHAKFNKNGKTEHVGYFDLIKDAHKAHDIARNKYVLALIRAENNKRINDTDYIYKWSRKYS